MTDRELLEMAAKAAGWTWWQSKHGYWKIQGPGCEERAACCGWRKFDAYTGSNLAEPTPADALLEVGFDPLNDDGDALRLAVKLRLDVMFGFDDEENVVSVNANWDGAPAEVIQEILGEDVAEATRCAIVRAAAEIGRAMK